jgi:hypothetical protein
MKNIHTCHQFHPNSPCHGNIESILKFLFANFGSPGSWPCTAPTHISPVVTSPLQMAEKNAHRAVIYAIEKVRHSPQDEQEKRAQQLDRSWAQQLRFLLRKAKRQRIDNERRAVVKAEGACSSSQNIALEGLLNLSKSTSTVETETQASTEGGDRCMQTARGPTFKSVACQTRIPQLPPIKTIYSREHGTGDVVHHLASCFLSSHSGRGREAPQSAGTPPGLPLTEKRRLQRSRSGVGVSSQGGDPGINEILV